MPTESFPPRLLDARVCERIGRSLAAAGGPGLAGVGAMVVSGSADDGRPGWSLFGSGGDELPWRASIDGRVSAQEGPG